MKKYPCKLSPTGICKYGGNKTYNFGFVSGSASYCRKDKKFVSDLVSCPLKKDIPECDGSFCNFCGPIKCICDGHGNTIKEF